MVQCAGLDTSPEVPQVSLLACRRVREAARDPGAGRAPEGSTRRHVRCEDVPCRAGKSLQCTCSSSPCKMRSAHFCAQMVGTAGETSWIWAACLQKHARMKWLSHVYSNSAVWIRLSEYLEASCLQHRSIVFVGGVGGLGGDAGLSGVAAAHRAAHLRHT